MPRHVHLPWILDLCGDDDLSGDADVYGPGNLSRVCDMLRQLYLRCSLYAHDAGIIDLHGISDMPRNHHMWRHSDVRRERDLPWRSNLPRDIHL